MTREKFVFLDKEKKKDRYFVFRCRGNGVHYGGVRRRGFGIEYGYGTTGQTYGDPRDNMQAELIVNIWRWQLSITYCWKRS